MIYILFAKFFDEWQRLYKQQNGAKFITKTFLKKLTIS